MAKDQHAAYPTEAEVDTFRVLQPLINSALTEMREFAKKKQDGVVNGTKVQMLNRLFEDVRKVLAKEPSSRYLDSLNADELPQNSDVVLILGQYQAAMNNFAGRFYNDELGNRFWITQERLKAGRARQRE